MHRSRRVDKNRAPECRQRTEVVKNRCPRSITSDGRCTKWITGDHTDPWGTPHVRRTIHDLRSPRRKYCVRPSRYQYLYLLSDDESFFLRSHMLNKWKNEKINSRPHALTPQSFVVVIQLYNNCSSFYLPRRDGSQRRACPLRGSNPDLLHTWVTMCRSG